MPTSMVTRRELLRRTGIGAAAAGVAGAAAPYSFAGPLRHKGRWLSGELRILQWSHFVPAYDKWFDDVYIKRWGDANDVEVKVDHINQAELPARAAAEVAAQSGHDMVALLAPPAQYEDQVIDHREIVEEVQRKRGKMIDVCYRSSYNPRTKKYFCFPDSYAPDPVNWRTDLWGQVGARPNTWDDVRKAAPKLREIGNPIGIGMSNELDSNMAMIALMMCFGSFIQDEQGRVTLNSKQTVDAVKFGVALFKAGMTDEIFAWTASSNNTAYLAGKLSLALNAISIPRSAELQNPDLAAKTALAPIPEGPNGRLGLEHVMHSYVIWKFAKNKEAAQKFLVDLEVKYIGAFENSRFYNFPSFARSVTNIKRRLERDTAAQPKGKYTILDEISQRYTKNVGYPGFSNAAVDEAFNKFLIPQMFAQAAQGKMTPEESVRAIDREVKAIFDKWRKAKKV